MSKTILCIGSINIDLTMYMPRLPAVGETVITDNFATFPGGKGGNQAAVIAELGGDVRYFTMLGDDDFSAQLTQGLIARGVDMSRVLYEPGETSGIAMIRVDDEGRNSISITPGANAKLSPEHIRTHADIFDGCEILLVSLEISADTVYEAVRQAKARGMTVIIDPAPVPAGGIPLDVYPLIDYAKPNEIEAEGLTGIAVTDMASAERAYDKLVEMGIKQPVITMSDKGAYTKLDGEALVITPHKVDAVDTTAAGDVFLGAFTTALSQDRPIKECLRFANAAAGLSTTRKGAQSSIPALSEVNSLM